jgi:arylsulfatase A
MTSIIHPRVFLLLSLSLTIYATTSEGYSAEKPNIIFFLADDMGIGDTSAYQDWTGNPDDAQLHTPAMDELAAMGVRFTDAHSPSSRCSPTRYAFMTGRYCWRTWLKHWVLFGVQVNPLIERERVTLPEYLQSEGYRTGLVGKWHLGLAYHNSDGKVAQGWEDADLTQPVADGPMDHGFDFFYGISRSHPTSGPHGAGKKGNTPTQAKGPGWMHNRKIVGATGEGKKLKAGSYQLHEVGNVIDQQTYEFLKPTVAEAKPFFLYFASPANHTPHTPSDKIGDMQIVGASKNVDGSLAESTRLDFVYQNDVHIARLLNYLRTTDDPRRPGKSLIDNTIFIFSSDNGSENKNKQFTGPLKSNKGSTYEGGHRVPFMVTWPAGGVGDGNPKTPGKTCDRVLALTDMFATIAEILEKPLPPLKGKTYGAEDSVSQLAAMRGESYQPRIPIFPNDHNEASKKLSDERAWVAVYSHATPIAGKWKLFLDHRYAFNQEYHPKELYNLEDDLKEEKNLIEQKDLKPVIDFLLSQAKLAEGDQGSTRQLQK